MRLLIGFLLLFHTTFAQSDKDKVQALLTQRNYKQAEEFLLKLKKEQPDDIKIIELLGDTYGYQEDWDNAIDTYKILTEKSPNNADYHYKYGGSLGRKAQKVSKFRALGLIGDVKDELRIASELDPKHIEVRWALVDLYVSLPGIIGGSFKKALKYANELEQLSKLDGYLAKGYIYEYDNEDELAKTYYNSASQLSENIKCSADVERNALRYQIGKMSADYKLNLDKGIYCLNVYIENATARDGVPKHWAYYRLSQIYRHKEEQTKALEYVNKALALQPDFKQAQKEKVLIQELK